MSNIAASEKESHTREPNWLMTCRIILVIGAGEIAAALVPRHTDWAYLGGLLLGLILELLIFPRLAWKRNLFALLIVVIAGALRIGLKSSAP
jgi:uncharacterized membrane protein YdcZ (DUF606 family)